MDNYVPNMTIVRLKDYLKSKGQHLSGKKTDLIKQAQATNELFSRSSNTDEEVCEANLWSAEYRDVAALKDWRDIDTVLSCWTGISGGNVGQGQVTLIGEFTCPEKPNNLRVLPKNDPDDVNDDKNRNLKIDISLEGWGHKSLKKTKQSDQ